MSNKAKKTEKDEYGLTGFERQFVDLLFKNNFNGLLTYRTLKPELTQNSAAVESSRLLKNPNIQYYIDVKKEQIRKNEEIELSWLVKELKNIVYEINTEDHLTFDDKGKALNKPDYRNKIEAIKTLAKLAGYEQPKKIDITTDGQAFNEIPQEITININKSKK